MDGLASLAAAATLMGEFTTEVDSCTNANIDTHASVRTEESREIIDAHVNTTITQKRKFIGHREKIAKQRLSKDEAMLDISATDQIHSIKSEYRLNSFLSRLPASISHRVKIHCRNEWFYSTLDMDYFRENEFLACLHLIGLNTGIAYSRSEWNIIKGIMGLQIGRPRRFSPKFLLGERSKLEEYRARVRIVQNHKEPVDTYNDFSYEVSLPLAVGDCVSTFHFPSKSIQRGLILSQNLLSDRTVFRIQFDIAELGHLTVSDTNLTLHGNAEVIIPRKRLEEMELYRGGNSSTKPRSNCFSSKDEGYRNDFFINLWNDCLKESNYFLSMLNQPLTNQETSSDSVDDVLPCIATLLFVREISRNIISSAYPQSLSMNADSYQEPDYTSVSIFLNTKIREFYGSSSDLIKKLNMVLLLAESSSTKEKECSNQINVRRIGNL